MIIAKFIAQFFKREVGDAKPVESEQNDFGKYIRAYVDRYNKKPLPLLIRVRRWLAK
jgi:hypothetical protein